jgi:hypothetical protein
VQSSPGSELAAPERTFGFDFCLDRLTRRGNISAMARTRAPLSIGWQAVKANALPGLVLQALMLSLLLGYYFSSTAAMLLNRLAQLKEQSGLLFVVLASICAGSLLPELFVVVFFQRGRIRQQNLSDIVFTAPLWAIDGILVDLMYRSLAAWLGNKASLPVVTAKICVDQLGYNPFFAAPYGIWGYAWKNGGYSLTRLCSLMSWQYYRDHAIPVLVATWAVWIPLMAMIYSLPLALQFPLFALALTFWVLLMTYMTNRFAGKIEADAALAVPAEG